MVGWDGLFWGFWFGMSSEWLMPYGVERAWILNSANNGEEGVKGEWWIDIDMNKIIWWIYQISYHNNNDHVRVWLLAKISIWDEDHHIVIYHIIGRCFFLRRLWSCVDRWVAECWHPIYWLSLSLPSCDGQGREGLDMLTCQLSTVNCQLSYLILMADADGSSSDL